MPPTTTHPDPLPLTLGEAAKRFGIETWQAQRAASGLNLPFIGPLRVVPAAMLPELREAARRRGYLASAIPAGAEAVAS